MEQCPNCGSKDVDRESVDVGVGIIYGPYGCFDCGWSEWSDWDKSQGPARIQKEYPNHITDSRGGVFRP